VLFPPGEALKANITTLGPLVLPLSEQVMFAGTMVARMILGKKAVRPYMPDFTTAFNHICIHTGGRGVIDEIEKHLQLDAQLIEPSRAALFRWVWWWGGGGPKGYKGLGCLSTLRDT